MSNQSNYQEPVNLPACVPEQVFNRSAPIEVPGMLSVLLSRAECILMALRHAQTSDETAFALSHHGVVTTIAAVESLIRMAAITNAIETKTENGGEG